MHACVHICIYPLIQWATATTAQEGPWNWFTTSDLGFPLVNDEYHRPMHPMIESDVIDYLRDPELLDDNEETGNLCDDSSHGLPEQMKLMLSDWGQQVWTKLAESLPVKPTNRERYSVPHAARNLDIIQDCKLAIEDPTAMILDPPLKGCSQVLDGARQPGHIVGRHHSVDLPGIGHLDHSERPLHS